MIEAGQAVYFIENRGMDPVIKFGIVRDLWEERGFYHYVSREKRSRKNDDDRLHFEYRDERWRNDKAVWTGDVGCRYEFTGKNRCRL